MVPSENCNLTVRSNVTADTVIVLRPIVNAKALPLFQLPLDTVLTTR